VHGIRVFFFSGKGKSAGSQPRIFLLTQKNRKISLARQEFAQQFAWENFGQAVAAACTT
jgi:hypothetical protein